MLEIIINKNTERRNFMSNNNNQNTQDNSFFEFLISQYTPKCPVCQSPNIQKISDISRVAHGVVFGLFSKTARSQWKCNNCGNLW